MGVSLKPSDAVAGGGLIDDVDVKLKQLRFRAWDYNGQIPTPVLGLAVTMDLLGPEGGEGEQVYSAGDMKHFVPSQDGRMAVAVGGKAGLNENTNAMAFLVSLVNCGFPENKIGDDVSVFEGTECHVNQVPQPKRAGLVGAGDKNKTILVVSKISKFPWDAAASTTAKAQPKKKTEQAMVSAGPANPVPSGNGEAVGLADQTLIAILADKGGEIAASALAAEAFKRLISHPLRTPVVQMIFTPDFLGAPGKPWAFDGTMVKLG